MEALSAANRFRTLDPFHSPKSCPDSLSILLATANESVGCSPPGAGAIDAKSPYTGGHCQRVPELARLLARAAQESDEEPFKAFALSEEEW